jgi:ribosomal protein S18 acetylase RimI-like enzyme
MTEQILTFRQANENDIDYLLRLRQETMTEHIVNSGLETSIEKHLDRINYEFNESKIILLADKAIGVLKLKKEDDKIEIIQLQIEPKYQGRGLGQDILNGIIKRAEENNQMITLSVLKLNPARNLYEKMGFEIIEEDKHSYKMIRQRIDY